MVIQKNDYRLVENLANSWLKNTFCVAVELTAGQYPSLYFSLKDSFSTLSDCDFRLDIEGIYNLDGQNEDWKSAGDESCLHDLNSLKHMKVNNSSIEKGKLKIEFTNNEKRILVIDESLHEDYDDWSVGWTLTPIQTIISLQGAADHTVFVHEKFKQLISIEQ